MVRSQTVGEKLREYLDREGLKEDASVAEQIPVDFFGERLWFPNPPFQRDLLARHDLHHLLLGYGTDLQGEAELGAWEWGAGSGHWFVWLNNWGALLLGLRWPIRTWKAYWNGRQARSLYRWPGDYQSLLQQPAAQVERWIRRQAG